MKRIVITTMTALAFFASAVAQNQNERVPAKGFAMFSAEDTFHPYEFTRHAIGDNDIQIEILYAGICHSDLHAAWDEQQEQGLHAAPHDFGARNRRTCGESRQERHEIQGRRSGRRRLHGQCLRTLLLL